MAKETESDRFDVVKIDSMWGSIELQGRWHQVTPGFFLFLYRNGNQHQLRINGVVYSLEGIQVMQEQHGLAVVRGGPRSDLHALRLLAGEVTLGTTQIRPGVNIVMYLIPRNID